MNEQEAKKLMLEMGYAINEKDRIIKRAMDKGLQLNYLFTFLTFSVTVILILVLSLLFEGYLYKVPYRYKIVKETRMVYVDKVVYLKNRKYIDISSFKFIYTKPKGKEVCDYFSKSGSINEFYTVCRKPYK